nr:immunoglobulin light chain junction region [Macaca mulatta]MOX73738.1 immunoglobulin light chain junction region [Macaca mulatta]MOX73893.1 immunoglobulin light chain junction region [Macaca mulatta]MOX75416.1 immunoglobulin light chain junction region [Macaca mulatta]
DYHCYSTQSSGNYGLF